MVKLETEIKNIREEIEELKRSLNQMNFNLIRIMGTLEKGVGVSSQTEDGEPVVGSVSVDLGPLEDRIEKIEEDMATKSEVEQIIKKVDELVSEKIANAEKMQERAHNLLEKGMELIELQSIMAEIKTLLEERILGDLDVEEESG
ncbi:MAG: hypothetical protein ACTSQE_03075 [Candidatus Heimdallarchaeaceae archaeon]